jgi:hypothetical protein
LLFESQARGVKRRVCRHLAQRVGLLSQIGRRRRTRRQKQARRECGAYRVIETNLTTIFAKRCHTFSFVRKSPSGLLFLVSSLTDDPQNVNLLRPAATTCGVANRDKSCYRGPGSPQFRNSLFARSQPALPQYKKLNPRFEE